MSGKIKTGIVTRSFGGITNSEAAKAMSARGFVSTELCLVQSDSNYWVYNGRKDLSDMSDKRMEEIVNTYRKEGIEVVSLGVFTNNIEENDEERQKNLDYFERYMQLAQYCGVKYVASECGFDPNNRALAAKKYESDFSRLKASLTYLCEKAEKYDVCVTLEPCVLDVIPSAKRMRDMINQIGSPRLKVLLDPANLIANSSEEDIFKYLAPHIGYFHGKDRKVNDAYGRLVGDGDINWPLFFSLYHKYTEGIPFMLEYANIDTAEATKIKVEAFDKNS